MPTSDYHQISDVLHVVDQINPASILEVGVGFGKWGTLCREVLEVYKGRVSPDEWQVQIDGIEIFESYRNELWGFAYDNIHIGDGTEIIDRLGKYDLILCCDVIEHFEKATGEAFLKQLLEHGSVVIITSPRGYAPQGPIYGNEHEEHKSGWSREDFSFVPHLYKEIGFTFMAVLGRDERKLEALKIQSPLDVLGFRKGYRELLKLAARRIRLRTQSSRSVNEA